MVDIVFNRGNSPEKFDEFWAILQCEHVEGFITSLCLDQLTAYLTAYKGADIADNIELGIRDALEIIHVDKECIEEARIIDIESFDLAIEVACAIKFDCLALVTLTNYSSKASFLGLQLLTINNVLDRSRFEFSFKENEHINQDVLTAIDPGQVERLDRIYQRKIKARRKGSFRDGDQLAKNDLRRENLKYSNLSALNLMGRDFSRADLSFSRLIGTQLPNSHLVRSMIIRSDCQKANFSGAYAAYANFRQSNFGWANLSRICLDYATLDGSTFICTNLVRANLAASSWVRADISNTNMKEANMKNALFVDASIKNSNLENTNLVGANFCGAKLRYSDFNSARMFRTKLEGADLTGADLSHADLTEADLRGADVTKTSFIGATVHNARIDRIRGLNEEQENELISRGAIYSEEKMVLFSASRFQLQAFLLAALSTAHLIVV